MSIIKQLTWYTIYQKSNSIQCLKARPSTWRKSMFSRYHQHFAAMNFLTRKNLDIIVKILLTSMLSLVLSWSMTIRWRSRTTEEGTPASPALIFIRKKIISKINVEPILKRAFVLYESQCNTFSSIYSFIWSILLCLASSLIKTLSYMSWDTEAILAFWSGFRPWMSVDILSW